MRIYVYVYIDVYIYIYICVATDKIPYVSPMITIAMGRALAVRVVQLNESTSMQGAQQCNALTPPFPARHKGLLDPQDCLHAQTSPDAPCMSTAALTKYELKATCTCGVTCTRKPAINR